MSLYSLGTDELWERARPPKGGAKRRHTRAAAAALPAEALAALLQLQPPLIQGQSVGLRLTIELVPSTSWGDNMRAVVSRRTWDQIRMAAYRASGYRCAICGAHGRLSCHEHWAYDDQTATQTLLGFLALCTMCHSVKHIGRAGQLARAGVLDYEALVKQMSVRTAHIVLVKVPRPWYRRPLIPDFLPTSLVGLG